ncbi:MAG: heparinase II/III family protein [Bacteroidales bacterium]|nr:heparinase II/III family protein [Bacteroidales bacterium]
MSQNVGLGIDVKLPAHPRLLMLKGEEVALKKNIRSDSYWTALHNDFLKEADKVLSIPVHQKQMEGKRMERYEAMRRTFLLGYAYRMTRQQKYAVRAEQELLCVSAYDSWNPSHFLDVAETTMALAIGYDWFFDFLPEASKGIIRTAIIEKGLKASLNEKDAWFLRSRNNWNQVCNAGMLYGALAVFENDRQFCADIVNRTLQTITLPMQEYAPQGAYPEGPGYWGYGTTYNVFVIAALEKALGTDFGLSEAPGFMQTGLYTQALITPSLYMFNYSDNGARAGFAPGVFWFYSKLKDPSLLYYQKKLYETNTQKTYLTNRWLILALLFGAGSHASLANPTEPTSLMYAATGTTPVAAMRSGWSEGHTFLGIKFGSASTGHAHMDVGSFIFEADGVRWAYDFGGENYNRLETRGVDLWGMAQTSQRWDVFRYRTQAHNTLCFNDKPQLVKARAELTDSGNRDGVMYAAGDLSAIYADQLLDVRRAVSLVDKKYAVIQDQFTTAGQFTKVCWNMLTEADKVTFITDTTALLEKEGKKLYLRVDAPFLVRFYTRGVTPTNTYDSPNTAGRFVGFEADLALNTTQQVTVYLMPDKEVAQPKKTYSFN